MVIKPTKARDYGAEHIDVNIGLDAVRATPQVYIGNPDSHAMFQCAKEPIDNSLDEAEETGSAYIGVSVAEDHTVWVYDAGRGIPIEPHPKTKISTFTTVLTTLSSGGKQRGTSENAAYKKSAGVHGMGVAITNAMSIKMRAWTCRKGKWYKQTFSKGKATSEVTKSEAPVVPLTTSKLKNRDGGTVICFNLDPSVFDKGSELSLKQLRQFLILSAYMHPKIVIHYADYSIGQKQYHQPEGMKAYAQKIIRKNNVEETLGNPFYFQDPDISLVLQWSAHDGDLMESFVNGSPTKDHGRHIDGLNKAITDSIAVYATKTQWYKPEDVRTGLIGVINVGVSSPRFSTQTKEKLVTPEALELVYEPVQKALAVFWSKNKSTAKDIIKRAVEIREVVSAFKANKKAAAELKNKDERARLPGIWHGSTTRDPKKRELFIVEGDSAGGTAKLARDKEYQEILKMRGKSINPYGAKSDKVLANSEVKAILRTIDYDASADNPLAKLRIGRVILLSDPDVDGKHINVLTLAIFQRLAPELFKRRMVYVVDSPLFNCFYRDKYYYGGNVEEVLKQLPKGVKPKDGVQRIKGWGEVGPDVLEHVAFNPKTRKLTRIKPVSPEDLRTFAYLLGKDAQPRRKLLGIESTLGDE